MALGSTAATEHRGAFTSGGCFSDGDLVVVDANSYFFVLVWWFSRPVRKGLKILPTRGPERPNKQCRHSATDKYLVRSGEVYDKLRQIM